MTGCGNREKKGFAKVFFFSFFWGHEIRGRRGISTSSGPVLRLFLRVTAPPQREYVRGGGEEKGAREVG